MRGAYAVCGACGTYARMRYAARTLLSNLARMWYAARSVKARTAN
jgi:hypothetical protein